MLAHRLKSFELTRGAKRAGCFGTSLHRLIHAARPHARWPQAMITKLVANWLKYAIRVIRPCRPTELFFVNEPRPAPIIPSHSQHAASSRLKLLGYCVADVKISGPFMRRGCASKAAEGRRRGAQGAIGGSAARILLRHLSSSEAPRLRQAEASI